MAVIRNKHYLTIYFIIWMASAILQTLSIYSASDLPFELLAVDTLVRSILFIPVGILIYSAMKYTKYEKFSLVKQFVYYKFLFIVSVSIWLFFGYIFDYLFTGKEITRKLLVSVLPFYILIGFMVYLILILFFKNRMILSKLTVNIEKNINQPENIIQDADMQSVKDVEILERIAVKSGQKINVVIVSNIIYLQAFGDYVYIFTDSGKYLKEQTMKYFENKLPQQFIRIHRSYIVNIESISRIELYKKQNQLLILKNGHQIKISSTGYKLLKQTLNL